MTNRQGRLRIRVAVFACISAALLIVDQVTKAWAMAVLDHGQSITVIPRVLSLTLVRNPGASLGFGSGATWLISLLAFAACIAMVMLAARTPSKMWLTALACAFAGALGNLIDRVAYAEGFLNGRVVDFLDYGWSVGNIADIYLTVAGVAIVVLIVAGVPMTQKEADARQEAAQSKESAHQ